MEQLVIGIVVLVSVVVIRRKEAFRFQRRPEQGTWFAIGAGLLASVLSISLLLLPQGSLAALLVHYGGIYLVCGVLIPWGYTLLVEHRSPAAMGLHRRQLPLSLLINLGLAILFLPIILFEGDLGAVDWGQFGKAAVVLVGAGGLFELFLYYGFIHLRLKEAFGFLPAILLTTVFYVAWHAGTQLPLEADPLLGALKLFGVGLMYQSIFALTYNALIIWPFFHGVGVMIDFTVNIGRIERVASRLPWAVGSMVAMALVGALLAGVAERRPQRAVRVEMTE